MKVIDHIADFEKLSYGVVTIGTFDGVHVGHQAILSELVEEAKKQGGKSVLITFWPHPRFILKKDDQTLKLLSTFQEKCELLDELGLDFLIKIPFTPEFSNLTPLQFVEDILVSQIGTKKLYIGYDHRFGRNREGNIDFLKAHADQFGYEVFEIPRQDIDSVGVSSTKIRNALHNGEVDLATSLLGRSYELSGKVIRGEELGRTIGFPTANIQIDEDYKLLPGDGAYAVNVKLDGDAYHGMLNVGFKPTVDGKVRTIEVHILNFEENIYDREITIEFVKSLRKEMKFDSLDELKAQLKKDKEQTIEILT